MNTDNRFQEVGSNSSNNVQWKPQATPLVQDAPFPALDGYFKELKELTAANGTFNVAVIVTVNPDGSLGQEVDVSGGQVLDNKLSLIQLGTFIRIQYEGKVASRTPGRNYNVWRTFEDANAIPYAQLGGAIRQTQAAPVQQVQQPAQPTFNPQQGFHPQQTMQGNYQQPAQPFTATAQPTFNPQVQQAAPVQQQPFVAAQPVFQPQQTQQVNYPAQHQNQPVTFGGQPQQGNPFATPENGTGLPF